MASAGDSIFREAVACEEQGKHAEAKRLYERLVAEQPNYASAHVNLGTLRCSERNFTAARRHFEDAIRVSPDYALAYFNLANVMDELGDPAAAKRLYGKAVELAPGYADAHYNLALLLDKGQEPRQALLHWQAYAKLDFGSKWQEHAAGRIKNIVAGDILKLACSTLKPKRTKRRASLGIAWSRHG